MLSLAAAGLSMDVFLFSLAGIEASRRFGGLLGQRAEIAGGAILIAIGLKIFIEHTFF